MWKGHRAILIHTTYLYKSLAMLENIQLRNCLCDCGHIFGVVGGHTYQYLGTMHVINTRDHIDGGDEWL